MKKYIALVLIELYLVITLLVFAFGPVKYQVPDPHLFWLYIFCYHLYFVLGYQISVWTFSEKRICARFRHPNIENLSNRRLFLILCLAFIASILSFKGTTLTDLFNPLHWVRSAMFGILNPGEAYLEKMARVEVSVSNKLLNIILFFIAFSKIALFSLLIYGWKKYTPLLKLAASFVILLPVLSSLSYGTNKALFDFIIIISTVTMCKSVYLGNTSLQSGKKRQGFKIIRVVLLFILLGLVLLYFGNAMGSRGGSLVYIEKVDGLGNVSVRDYAKRLSEESALFYMFSWLTTYLVQGYYGLSVAMTQEFDFTFFVGNSEFLTRNFEGLLGVDLSSKTYQAKIDEVWDASAQWHSFYSYLANDFYFPGVVLPMLLLGYLVSQVWLIFMASGNIYAGSLLSVIAIMVIFMPANNQIFGFLDGLSSFCVLSFLLWCSGQKRLRKFV